MITEDMLILFNDFSLANLWTAVQPLSFFILAIVVYSIFIFKFYRFLAKRELFAVDIEKYTPDFKGFMGKVVTFFESVFKYFFIYPIFLFFWFLVLTILLILLTKSQSIQTIMLIAMALIGAVRVTAYYNEDLSKDLAKMMPFALLGVFLVDISAFNYAETISLLVELPGAWKTGLYYLVMITFLEMIMRIARSIAMKILGKSPNDVEEA